MSDIFELVSAYRASVLQAGGTFPDAIVSPHAESRDIGDQPRVDQAATKRSHFRGAINLRPTSTIIKVQSSANVKPVLTETEPVECGLDDSADKFPTGSRIQVRHLDSGWWSGTVQRSFISSPRDGTLAPMERRIVVTYDDASSKGELFEHGLRGTAVRTLDTTARLAILPASRLVPTPSASELQASQRTLRQQQRTAASIAESTRLMRANATQVNTASSHTEHNRAPIESKNH